MFKKIIPLLILLLWPNFVFAGEYWIDNNGYGPDKNGNLPPIAKGTKAEPFGCVKDLKTVVSSGSAHTIHIAGSMRPYEGGLGGYGLAKYYFGSCVIIKDQTKFPVMFKAIRTIKTSDLSAAAGKYNIPVSNKFDAAKYRFYKNTDGNLVLIRPEHLTIDTGYLYDKASSNIELDVGRTVPSNGDLNSIVTEGAKK